MRAGNEPKLLYKRKPFFLPSLEAQYKKHLHICISYHVLFYLQNNTNGIEDAGAVTVVMGKDHTFPVPWNQTCWELHKTKRLFLSQIRGLT